MSLVPHSRPKSTIYTLLLVAILSVLSIGSCKNDIDINADWKETLIIYGVLDPLDTVQYIRIEKAFLDQTTGAQKIAAISDSLFPDSVVVTLSCLDSGTSYKLSPAWNTPKDAGIFANDKNQLWKLRGKVGRNKNYRIDVVNPLSGKHIWANTRTLDTPTITSPVKLTYPKFTIIPDFITIEFTPRANSYAYDVTMEVVYDEFAKSDSSNKTEKTATWNMVTNQQVQPNTAARIVLPRLAFLQYLTSTIKADSAMYHRIKYMNMTWYGGNQQLVDFISVNQPSIGIVQKTAEYTNIENGGFGIFASRNRYPIRKITMDKGSIQLLQNHSETKKLNFLY